MKQLVFLVYMNRSGSTYLSRLLDSYDDVAVSLEAHIPDGLVTGSCSIRNQEDLSRYLETLYRDRKFTAWGVDRNHLEKALQEGGFPLTFDTVLPVILDTCFGREKKVAVYKSPYLFYLERIMVLFPNAKVLYISRDPRAIYNSQKNTRDTDSGAVMAPDPVKIAIRYKLAAAAIDRVKAMDWFHEVKYEDLVKDRERVLAKVLDFVGSSGIKGKDEDYYTRMADNQKQIHENIGSRPLSDRIDKWKTGLKRGEIWMLEWLCRREMTGNGYVLSEDKPGLPGRIAAVVKYGVVFLCTLRGKYTLLRLLWQRYIRKGIHDS